MNIYLYEQTCDVCVYRECDKCKFSHPEEINKYEPPEPEESPID